ncbi:MAG: hypothetical protein ACD_75C01556G0001 [uncultured bacterium]|nr:MAG: hypothetical protein ACD_75C01556G0001 [uncultured bacterium]
MASAANGQEPAILERPVDGVGHQLHRPEIGGAHHAGTDAQDGVAYEAVRRKEDDTTALG